MASRLTRAVLSDVTSQYAHPKKSLVGSIISRLSAVANKNLVKGAVDALNIAPDDNILEIGYGRGYGIGLAHEKIKNGDGAIFGIEASRYMEDVTFKRFILEITDTNAIRLDKISDLRILPYPSDLMNGVFHVDSFYFWGPNLLEILGEIQRIMKPGATIACAMQLSRLKKLEKLGLINESQYNASRYLLSLEPAGFEDIRMDYVNTAGRTPFELITAKKSYRRATESAAEIMQKLEIMIKREMYAKRLFELNRPIYDPEETFPNAEQSH